MTTQTIETNKNKTLDFNFKKEQIEKKQELLEELSNRRKIFLVKKFKEKFENEEKDSPALSTSLWKTFLSEFEKYAQEKGLSNTIKKRIGFCWIEMLSNLSCYSTPKKPFIFQLNQYTDSENKKVYKIQTRNYYDDTSWEKTAKLEKRLEFVNSSPKEEIKQMYKEVINNWDEERKNESLTNKYWNAGLWFLDMARKLKESNMEPFTYEFTKQKDGTVKFDLTITIPEQNKEQNTFSK